MKKLHAYEKINMKDVAQNSAIKPEYFISDKAKNFGKSLFCFSMAFILYNGLTYLDTSKLLREGRTKQSIENHIERIEPANFLEKSMKFMKYDLGIGGRKICYLINKKK